VPVTDLDVSDLLPMEQVLAPAIRLVRAVLPGMIERGSGTLLFAGGASGAVPMPPLGNYGPASAAYRNYLLTLHAALAGTGVHVGVLTIGGLIKGGDIERAFRERQGTLEVGTLDPDELADAAWSLHVDRDRAEQVFTAAA
jgi:short-subunit dehydrogenase